MKKVIALCAVCLILVGCGAKKEYEVSEDVYGRWSGTYEMYGYDDLEVPATIYIHKDGSWDASYGIGGWDDSEGVWKCHDKYGKELTLYIKYQRDEKEYDKGWTFRLSGSSAYFGFNDFVHYDVKMEK